MFNGKLKQRNGDLNEVLSRILGQPYEVYQFGYERIDVTDAKLNLTVEQWEHVPEDLKIWLRKLKLVEVSVPEDYLKVLEDMNK